MTSVCKKSILIAVSILLVAALSLPCLFAEADVTTDFSRRGYTTQTIDGVAFLTDCLGLKLQDGEQKYLENHSQFQVRYSSTVPSSYIDVQQNGDTLDVHADAYTYTANNEQRVTWSPVNVNGASFEKGNAALQAGTEDFVTVEYVATLNVECDLVNTLVNSYYFAAKEVADYESYLAALEQYNNVLLPQYERYLEELLEWELKNRPYQEYLQEYARYLEELYAYENYDPQKAELQYQEAMQRYIQYQADLESYNEQYRQYLDSLTTPEMQKLYRQLTTLRYIYAECNERSLRSAIMGNTVTQVLANSKDLKLYLSLKGKDGKAIEHADTATRNLRDLIKNYENCTTDEARYAFYITCYDKLRLNFTNLLRCLDYFYRDGYIRDNIQSNGKDMQYRILLAQLFEIVNALNNGKVSDYERFYNGDSSGQYFDDGYRIGGKTPESILGDCLLTDTEDALPLENGVPQMPREPEKPQEVERPQEPQQPQMPLPPEEVDSPGDPPEVLAQPQMPEEAFQPNLSEEEQKTLLAVWNKGLVKREELTADCPVTVHTQVKKYFRNHESITVFFHVTENSDPYPVEGERGEYVEYPSDLELPQKTRRGYTCTFDGWTYSDGTDVDWNNPREGNELHLYPKFVETPNLYDVIFVVDGVEYRQKAAYDSIPQFEGTLAKSDDADGRKYRFLHWDRPLEKMTEETVTYTAVFESSVLVTWKVDETNVVTSVWKGEMPVYPYGTPAKEPDKFYAYTFKNWDKTPSEAVADVVYTANFGKKPILVTADGMLATVVREEDCYVANVTDGSQNTLDLTTLLQIAQAKSQGVKINYQNGSVLLSFDYSDIHSMLQSNIVYCSFEHSQSGRKEYIYTLKLLCSDQSPAVCEFSVLVTVSGSFNVTNSLLYRKDNTTPERMSVTDSSASFSIHPNEEYRVLTRYNVSVAGQSANFLFASATANLVRGSLVNLTVGKVPVGQKLERVYALDAEGNEITIENNSFVMPESNVTLFTVLSYIDYTVTFKSEGKTISTRVYHYGDKVEIPSNPVKAPDGKYSYIFDRWDNDVVAVVGDAEYNAVYISTPLEESNGKFSSKMKWIIAAATVSAAVIVALSVALPIVIVRKKRRKNVASQQETGTDEAS